MIPRKQLDIAWFDLAAALCSSLTFTQRSRLTDNIVSTWSRHELQPELLHPPSANSILVSLSVRSGFDATLEHLAWPPGSEVLVSAITIRDMPRILEAHQLRVVPVDVEMDSLSMRHESLAAAITPRTRGILAAHLFGSRMPMQPIIDIARQHGLFVFEDCAQAFTGCGEVGDPGSDVRMFSFGPIKTATALGGAILSFRDPPLRDRVAEIQSRWPVQSPVDYLRRILRFGVIKFLSMRTVFTGFAAGCRLLGQSHDQLLSRSVRGFSEGDFFPKIRRQPSTALLSLLARRLNQNQSLSLRIERRLELANQLDRALAPLDRPGRDCLHHLFWIYPIHHDQPDELMRHLWSYGFDATRGASTMRLVEPVANPDATIEPELRSARISLARLLYLPFNPSMTKHDVERLAAAITGFHGLGAREEAFMSSPGPSQGAG